MGNLPKGGTGEKLTHAVVVVAGVASLAASLLSIFSIWLQLKNYRKPLLQRYVVRILLMVPIYSVASFTSMVSIVAAFWIDPVRDVYEAFTIYTFLQLLVNFIGGERSLIILMHGRQPVSHLWPLNHVLAKVDISDPHTFLAIKRGILQYAYLKPLLAFATIIMKATGSYKEGYLGLDSGYLWCSIVYNVSISLSLYSLALFWICMSEDLQPFRPMPKFLCIKLVIFASYWQGFFLSILVWLKAIPDGVEGYSSNNIATAIQNALICFEMPAFAIAHWYAFSWHDYADVTISAARMPMKYALRDAFGPRDLIEDTKMTVAGKNYEYRAFDSGDNVLAHEESASRVARMMEGMRYERGGKGKYWISKPGEATARTPLLADLGSSGARTMSPSVSNGKARAKNQDDSGELERTELDDTDENLYKNARALEFGDWNYPVITAHEASRERWMSQEPSILTTSTNRNLMQPTRDGKAIREDRVQRVVDKGKRRESSTGDQNKSKSHSPIVSKLLRRESSSSGSAESSHSQLVDLVVEDHAAEEVERVRARKEGGAEWNKEENRHFVRTYSDEHQGEQMREGYEPPATSTQEPTKKSKHNPKDQAARPSNDVSDTNEEGENSQISHIRYDSFDGESNIWRRDDHD